MRERLDAVLKALALGSWSAVILSLAVRGDLGNVVQVRNPLILALTTGAAAALALLAIAALRPRRGSACACEGHAHGTSIVRPLGILALAVLAIAVKPPPLGHADADRKELRPALARVELLGFGDDAPAGAYEPANLLTIRYAAERDPLALFDRPVVLEGFRRKIDGAPDDLYQLSRFTMTCCVADAFPISLTVIDESGPPPPEGAWVQAIGTLQWDRLGHAPVLIARRVAEIPEPDAPYLSPNDRELDFLTGIGATKPGTDAPAEEAP